MIEAMNTRSGLRCGYRRIRIFDVAAALRRLPRTR
jgi:hypothetical protein